MTPPGQGDGHRVVIEFDDGVSAKLICPESGCEPPLGCASCARPTDAGNEIERCYDCPSPTDECWIKSWFDNLTADELLHGSIEVPIRAEWDGDHMVAHIEPEAIPVDRDGGQEREALSRLVTWAESLVPENGTRDRLIADARAALAAREDEEGVLEREQVELLDHTHDVIWERFERRERKLREALRSVRTLLVVATHERLRPAIAQGRIDQIDAALAARVPHETAADD